MSKVLVLAVHPDDETLGCGGAILKHKAEGDQVFWLIATCMTQGAGFSKGDISRREREIKTVAKRYGFSGVHELGIPATQVDQVPMGELVKRISAVFREVEPEIVYLPFFGDVHSDHRLIFQATQSCTKTFRCPSISKLLMMETISETEFAPATEGATFVLNYFVDITGFLDAKIEIAKLYETEIGKHPFPRSEENIKALATFRGATAGCIHAESFMILKEIW